MIICFCLFFFSKAEGETAVLVAGDPEREHMRKVRQDGAIHYHVNLLQNMVCSVRFLVFSPFMSRLPLGMSSI